eukprot:scaffold4865_cov83-Cyclotella_meneghiniana.AAC.8
MDHQPQGTDQPAGKEHPQTPVSSIQRTLIQIRSATYGPAEGRRLLDGTLVDYSNRESFIPYTRDVISFLAALGNECSSTPEGGPCFHVDNKNTIALMDGKSMNSIFGDPCPGTTKLLRVQYLFHDYISSTDSTHDTNNKEKFSLATSRVYTSTFAEHDRILLRRQDALFRVLSDAQLEDQEKHNQPPLDNPENTSSNTDHLYNTMGLQHSSNLQSTSSELPSPHHTKQNTSELTLRLVLPYLTVRERAKCQLVCSSWRCIVLYVGIAVSIDVNDTSLFPKVTTNVSRSNIASLSPFVPPSPAVPNENSEGTSNTSRALLRGLLTHSHSSLESLVLNDYLPLRPVVDLNPTLPHLRKLKRLDISRIPTVTDETLNLISTFIGERLEVLYMKGLSNITNTGVVQLVEACTNLRVLDVSHLHQLEDEAGIAIGRHLPNLEVFHARDNYRWTNKSIDLITANCKRLVQATFWGCIQLSSLQVSNPNQAPTDTLPTMLSSISNQTNTKLILLNLWGCHGLQNSSAALISSLIHLRSLCVSECHKLSDDFVIGIAQSLHHLVHLQLRYLRRITDDSIEVISSTLPNLYSLDVSFCTKLTIEAIAKLLRERSESLAELRLFSCRQLNLDTTTNTGARISSGRRLAQALRSIRQCSILSVLDLRKCHDQMTMVRDELFLRDMLALGFIEELRGFFSRPAVCSENVTNHLAETLHLGNG